MKNYRELEKTLISLERKSYSAYKSLKGDYKYDNYILSIDHVQSDPYAPPSKMRIVMPRKVSGIPEELTDTKDKEIAVSDFLTRNFYKEVRKREKGSTGTGGSGRISIDRCGQEILERTSVLIKKDKIEVRFELGLPAAGRRIMGKAAKDILTDLLPEIAEKAIVYKNIDKTLLKEQITLMLDQQYIRKVLKEKGYDGKELIFGIRPEDVNTEAAFLETFPESVVKATISVSELLGSESHLYCQVGDNEFIAKVDARDYLETGATIELGFDLNKAHFFDKETEKTVY